MNPDSLKAVSDSLQAVAHVATFLHSSFPWLSEPICRWLAAFATSVPIVASIFAWELVGKWLNYLSPALKSLIGDKLARWSWLINPLLGALLGQSFFGNSALGLVAAGAWSGINAASKATIKVSPAGLVRARTAAILLGLGLLLASATQVSAAPAVGAPTALVSLPGWGPHASQPEAAKVAVASPVGVPWLSFTRCNLAVGLGLRYDAGRIAQLPRRAWQVRPSYMVTNHVKVEGRLWSDFRSGHPPLVTEGFVNLVW